MQDLDLKEIEIFKKNLLTLENISRKEALSSLLLTYENLKKDYFVFNESFDKDFAVIWGAINILKNAALQILPTHVMFIHR